MSADWKKIKTEYITTDTSYRKLAQKYGVSYITIAKRAKEENWVEMRKQTANKTLTKTISKISDQQARKMARIEGITDRLLDKLEQAVQELDQAQVTNKTKTKVIEYTNYERPDKPTKEITTETEEILAVASIVDRLGLRQLAAALKDLKEIQMLKSDLDRREQEARIANLQKQAEKEDTNKEPVRVIMDDGLSEYSE